MENKNKYSLGISLIAIMSALVGALGGSYISSNYLFEIEREKIRNEIRVLSGKNSFHISNEIKKRAEVFLLNIVRLEGMSKKNKASMNEIRSISKELNSGAAGLLIYGGPELGAASLRFSLALSKFINTPSGSDFVLRAELMKKSAEKWFAVYFKTMATFDKHTMPEYKSGFPINLFINMLQKQKQKEKIE